MNPMLQAKAGRNGGLFTVADAHDAGVLTHEIQMRVRRREWVRVRRGVYMVASIWQALDGRGRGLAAARAATLTLHRGWVLSHATAAVAHGLPLLGRDHDVHITRAGYTSAWTRFGVSHHYARYRPDEVVEVDGLPCLDVPRTVVDVARDGGVRAGVVVADAALRAGHTRSALERAVTPMRFWPGVINARSVVDLADARAENPNESLARLLVSGLGFGPADPQFPIRLGDGVRWCDLRVGNHIFEVDGRIKYQSPEHGGVATRGVEEAIWEEKRRERLIRALGLGVSRILWEDHSGTPEQVEAATKRLTHEVEMTNRAFGPELHPHLAQDAADLRARFGWRDGDAGRRSA